jgi:putative addiction module component (TIGR02574 family)
MRIPGLSEASVDEKLALIDELWESVRRSTLVEVREDHLQELSKRVAAVNADPSIALTPTQARALLRR